MIVVVCMSGSGERQECVFGMYGEYKVWCALSVPKFATGELKLVSVRGCL